MLSRENFLLAIVPLLGLSSALQMDSCIRYETYQVVDYQMAPLQFSDNWFNTRFHFSPRKQTKIGLRSRRLYGCCMPGFRYASFPVYRCIPECKPPCEKNAYCSENGLCKCAAGYHKTKGMTGEDCLLDEATTEFDFETTSIQPPCNGSCGANEECSISDDTCVCRNGFERSVGNDSFACVPKCDPRCQHGNCTAPNTCQCWEHYERINDTFCRLRCSKQSCVYGECNTNGICDCAHGFLNNGTACVWGDDAILTEPDDCDCWSKFVWQNNQTEGSAQHCLPLCNGDDSLEPTSECINFKYCQSYEGMLVCHAQMFKCIALVVSTSEASSTLNYSAAEFSEDKTSNSKLIVLILVFLAAILVVGGILLIWQKRRSWLTQLWSYKQMRNAPGEEQI